MKYAFGFGAITKELALESITKGEILITINKSLEEYYRPADHYKHPTHLNVGEISVAWSGVNEYYYGIKRIE